MVTRIDPRRLAPNYGNLRSLMTLIGESIPMSEAVIDDVALLYRELFYDLPTNDNRPIFRATIIYQVIHVLSLYRQVEKLYGKLPQEMEATFMLQKLARVKHTTRQLQTVIGDRNLYIHKNKP